MKKLVLKCLLYMAVFSLAACGRKGVESQEIQENPVNTPMTEESLSVGSVEDISLADDADMNDPDGVNWDEILKVPADKAKNEENPENRMAHNVYADPDLSATCGKFDGFMIDFKADKTGTATYWALCNWQMNKEDLMGKYDVIDVYAGAYAGLQMRPDGPKAIMSFWEIKYKDASGNEKKIEATRIYPSDGDTNKFAGEGEGSNYICDYQWEMGKWYRMYLNCYQDESGKTFVEQWVADLSTDEWTLISRFDTGLYNSYFEGGMSQFMENYDSNYANETRTFEYRNICVREYGQTDWTAICTADLSVDTCWDNKKGSAFYGATKDRFYGIANGYGPDVFEKDEVVRDTFTVEVTTEAFTEERMETASSEEVIAETVFEKELKETDNPRITEILNVSGTYFDGFNQDHYHYRIPQFNADSESAKTVNKRIEEDLSEIIESEAWHISVGVSLITNSVDYEIFEYGDITAIVVTVPYPNDCMDYWAYTYDFQNHKELTNTELLAMKGMTEESFVTEVCRRQEEHFIELAKNWPNPMTDQEMIDGYVASVNAYASVDLPMYFDANGILQVYVPFASIAGADWYYQLSQF